MKDFNFFSPYILAKRNKRMKRIYILSVGSLLVIALLSFTVLNMYHISRYKAEISMVESYLSSDKTKELLKQYNDTKAKTQLLNQYYNKAEEADKAIIANNTATTALLDRISSIMPQDSFLLRLTVSDTNIEVNYSVRDLVSVAEIEHNLKELKNIENVHVNVIEAREGYTAMIRCSLKVGEQ